MVIKFNLKDFKKSFLFFGFIFVLIFGIASCTKKNENINEKVAHLVLIQKYKSMDPIQSSDLYSNKQVGMTYETLYQYHYLKRPYEVIPLLADGMPKVSEDKKTYTIEVKKGILFQDDASFKETKGKGRELTAEDFVYSLKRLADPKEMATGWWVLDGKIVGLNEWRESAKDGNAPDYNATVEGLQAIDRYTLQIKLKAPSHQFIYFLTMPFTAAVAREAVENYGKDFPRMPVGTGPFILSHKESNVNSKLVWVKNPNFRNETYPMEGTAEDKEKGLLADAGKQLPFMEKVIYHIMTEDSPRWLNFMNGDVDLIQIPKDNYTQAIAPTGLTDEMIQKGIQLHTANNLDVTFTSFNMDDPLFGKNKLLRQALSLAWDPKPAIELFYGNQAISAQGPIPPNIFGYNVEFVNRFAGYNLEKAKELLAQAGYPNGKGLPPIQFVGRTDGVSRQLTEYLTKSFERLGVKVEVKAFNWPEFLTNMNNKNGHMWALAWGADYPDAENFLQLFYSKNVAPGPNNANFRNIEYDLLYEKQLEVSNGPEKQKLIDKMYKILEEEAPWIFGVHRLAFELTNQWFKNYKPHDFDQYSVRYYNVDLEIKNQKKR